ncbi:hypothetical protein JL475_24455 [Streptomyces sp. M2CJ-2]|uniref:hypothetical protein n=1 Tax=Streptomyces sp. M2CJ-2 TaxID=2803948 RepID=UPI001926D16E|nr:hypothetical protein [Streptomyces sp. M2CJ-2]MBL3669088.1 hypothetical protein [Streptomyces sp. M2CJ-2]
MIAEALDTMWTLGWALTAWIAVFAAVGTIVIFATIAAGAWATRALWRATAGPSWRRSRLRARILARTRTRRASEPAEPNDYREAA